MPKQTEGYQGEILKVDLSSHKSEVLDLDKDTARSFIVPQMANFPMSPPGKKIGLTTYESVVRASFSEPISKIPESPSFPSMGLLNSLSRYSVIKSWLNLPPLPCASKILLFFMIFKIRRARPFARHHTGTHRRFRCAAPCE